MEKELQKKIKEILESERKKIAKRIDEVRKEVKRDLLNKDPAETRKWLSSHILRSGNRKPCFLDSLNNDFSSVEMAIRRLEKGTFGTCIECGTAVPLERILVSPKGSNHCVSCQEKM